MRGPCGLAEKELLQGRWAVLAEIGSGGWVREPIARVPGEEVKLEEKEPAGDGKVV